MTKPRDSLLYTILGGIGVATIVALGSIAWASKADKTDVVRLEGKIDRLHMAVCFSRRDVPGCDYK